MIDVLALYGYGLKMPCAHYLMVMQNGFPLDSMLPPFLLLDDGTFNRDYKYFVDDITDQFRAGNNTGSASLLRIKTPTWEWSKIPLQQVEPGNYKRLIMGVKQREYLKLLLLTET